LSVSNGEAVLHLNGGTEIRAPLVDEKYVSWEAAVPGGWELRSTARAGDWLEAIEMLARRCDQLPENRVREIAHEEVSVVQKINEILDLLEQQESIAFHQAFAGSGSKMAGI
jgi:chromatin segregation and condensation protein Rec8/ScpA/Scc1 (kleisin family)